MAAASLRDSPTAVAVGAQPRGLPPPRGRRALERLRASLVPLFPEGPLRPRSSAEVAAAAAATLAAVALWAWVLLERQVGVRPWNSVWAEDGGIFYPQAVSHPFASLLRPYNGYLQLVPRLIAVAVAALPFQDVAAGFAVAGAVVAATCAVAAFYASAGHVRALPLRLLLTASVILLPRALTEISANGVNTPWYLLFTMFWMLLWRPRSRGGMAVSFLICFAAASSNALAAVYAPLVLARIAALPRARDHAGTTGWAAGGVLQLSAVLRSPGVGLTGSPGLALSFFLHVVLVPAVAGQHLASVLAADSSGTVVVTAAVCAVAAVTGWALINADMRVRLLVTATLGLALAFVLVTAITRGWGTPGRDNVAAMGDRYATTPILLTTSLAIVAADVPLRRARTRAGHAWHALPALTLTALLAASWVSDFSYPTMRSSNPPWSRLVAGFQQRCGTQQTPAGWAQMPPMHWIQSPPTLPCSLAGTQPDPPPAAGQPGRSRYQRVKVRWVTPPGPPTAPAYKPLPGSARPPGLVPPHAGAPPVRPHGHPRASVTRMCVELTARSEVHELPRLGPPSGSATGRQRLVRNS
ncbi:MAG TPA: hypothetical protein VGS19_10990 [Streptosporangiaceae bacterium]|nr:hypothetical protein [Streptosporangiaceae bacterium]